MDALHQGAKRQGEESGLASERTMQSIWHPKKTAISAVLGVKEIEME